MNQTFWDTLAIVGVGLIGGSIGLAARERGLAKHVMGVGRRESPLRLAVEIGAITDYTTNLQHGVSSADLVVVCTPVDRIAAQVSQIARHCPATTLITDAGSTKADMVRAVELSIDDSMRFVGSHPLAGSHQSGPAAARADLFVERTVIVTPTDKTDSRDTAEVTRFWTALGANVITMSIDAHDAALAASSHVPHIVAAALASATPEEARKLVAGGWLDTTRIAAAEPELWTPILRQNRTHVLEVLERFTKLLKAFRDAVDKDDAAELQRLLEVGKQHRDAVGN